MKQSQGFTLIEVIIAMTLLALIMGMVGGALQLGTKSWDSADRKAQTLDDMRLVSRFIKRQLRQASAVTHYEEEDKTGARILAFKGEADRIYFVAPKPAHLGVDGLYHIQLLINDEDSDNYKLLLQYDIFRVDEIVPDATEDNVAELLQHVDHIQFEYFGSKQIREDPEWRDEWEHPHKLPLLVRLKLTVKGQVWPDLVVALPRS